MLSVKQGNYHTTVLQDIRKNIDIAVCSKRSPESGTVKAVTTINGRRFAALALVIAVTK
jgi:hypothetical protein